MYKFQNQGDAIATSRRLVAAPVHPRSQLLEHVQIVPSNLPKALTSFLRAQHARRQCAAKH